MDKVSVWFHSLATNLQTVREQIRMFVLLFVITKTMVKT